MTPWSLVRSVGVALALTVALAACGGAGEASTASTDPTDPTASTAVPVDVPGGFRLIRHAKGETLVPDRAERVVVLDSPQLDAALSVGVVPVGAVRSLTSATLPAYLGDTSGIEVIGTIEDPRLDLDAIRALQPDLILSSTTRHGRSYDDLAAIAPTVFAETVGANWRANYELFADAMGRPAEAQEQLAAYDAATAELRPALGDVHTAAVVRFMPDGIRLYSVNSFPGEVLTDLGLAFPAFTDDEQEISTTITVDEVPVIDSQVIFHMTYGPTPVTDRDDVLADPRWASLPASQAGDVFEVDDDSWMQGVGVLGAAALLESVRANLVVTP